MILQSIHDLLMFFLSVDGLFLKNTVDGSNLGILGICLV